MADKNFLTDIIDADLAEGKVQQIHTRFPPEPNGYLHIGSAKAIYINWSIANQYGGKFNLRLDDTNPAREGEEYVNSIIEDLHWLGADPNGGIFYGSDYFDKCYEYAEKLITEGKAYVDDLTREEMREYRGSDAGKPSRPSPWRDRSPEENLDLFRRMRAGEFKEGEKTLRAKIDLASPNMNMRDPAIYRIKYAEHHRQGNKWCIYPMYDFAHPIQDAIEGITHSMCSLEFENHRPLYNWVIENIFGTAFPKQREFARLNMTNTVMSKRYLRELVEMGIVDGWDDPRMPTLCGLRRRGYTPTSIFTFVREAGISKSDNLIDMRQLEACIRSELDLTAQRRIAVLDPVKLVVDNYPADKTEYFDVANNPNREANDTTTRKVAFTRELWIENEDFAEVPPPKFKRLTVDGEVHAKMDPERAIELLRSNVELPQARYNLALLEAQQRRLDEAWRLMDGYRDVNSAIVALSVNRNEEAASIMDGLKDDDSALASYVRALIAARSRDTEAFYTSLEKACSDENLRRRAAGEADFRPWQNESRFRQLLEERPEEGGEAL